ncbi:MAG: hypothetical protein IKH75_19185, partial [Ruminococcus sp.]|nr:hypothetical protein [Ruminococcus sp.]
SCHDDTSFVILVWLADHNYFNIGGLFFLLIAKAFLNPQFNWGFSEAKNSTCNCVCCRCCKSIICQFGLTAIFITNNGRKALVIEKKLRNIDFVPSVCYNSKYFVGGAT